MSFLHPQLLWLLLVPAALLVLALRPARSTPAAYPKIPHARLGPSGFRFQASALSPPLPVAASLALALLVAALARPQGGEITTPSVVRARDVLVAMDVSRSMLAEDVTPSRLERARLLVRSLADELQGERLGLLPFAGSAFLQSPLSVDYGILRTFLDELGPDMIPAGGSDFTALLTVADEAFGPAPSDPQVSGLSSRVSLPPASDRYLIILSDGEAQDDTWRPVAQKLADRGVRVITLGLGTAQGAMIPDADGTFVKDPRGAVVLSRLEASTLRELARLTDGAYRDASSWIDLPALLRDTVARGRATQTIEENSVRRAERFIWFLAPALALLILSLVREFPVTLRPRSLKLAALVGLSVSSIFLSPTPTRAAEPDPLLDLVTRLSNKDSASASDFLALANLTAQRGENGGTVSKSMLQDAHAAVAKAEKLDPHGAWRTEIKERLERLGKATESPQEPPSPQDRQDSSDPSDQSDPPDQPDEKPQPNPPPRSSESDSTPGTPNSSSAPPQPASDSSPAPKPSSDALGDLADREPPSPPQPAPGEESPSEPAQPPEPTQRAGGVSASGQPRDGSETAAADPALAIPQQRLDQIRDADSPARLFQLIQDSELTPEDRERAASGRTRDW